MPKTVHLPVFGNVPKGAVIVGGVGAVGVTGYMLWRHNQQKALAATSSSANYGYGAGSYGYNGFYGYGTEFQGYPVGEEYGYGAYGYGMYNPYTGQYVGPYGGGGGGVTPQPTPTPTPTPSPVKVPASKWFTVNGRKEYYSAARQTVGYWTGTGKNRKWTRVKI